MSCRYWRGEEPKYKQEREYIETLARKLEDANDKYAMFINFYVPDREIDIVVLKKNCIIIVELKNWEGKIKAQRNGDWELYGKDGIPMSMDNPYIQVTGQYYSFKDYLNKNKKKFLAPQKASHSDFSDVKQVICICPRLDRLPEFEDHRFIKVVGFDELYRTIWTEKSKGFNLSSEEINKLASIFNLEEWSEIHHILTPMKGPADFDWEGYLKSITKNKEYQELNSMYIPLKLSREKYRKGLKAFESVELEKVLNINNKLLVLAEPGAGKTTLLQKLTREYAKKNLEKKGNIIPVFVPMNLFDLNNNGLLGLIKFSFKKHGLDLSVKVLNNFPTIKKEFIFLFDGLNEISERERKQAILQLKRFIIENNQCKYIFTSRVGGDVKKIEDSETISINKFSKKDIFDFIKKFYFIKRGDLIDVGNLQKKIDPNLFDFLSIPLIAYFFSIIFLENEDFEDYSKNSIFQEFVNLTLNRERKKSKLKDIPTDPEMEMFLSCIAFKMMEEESYALEENEFENMIKDIWEQLSKDNEISCALSDISYNLSENIILNKRRDKIFFWHPQLQEFFAAKELRRLYSKEIESALDKLLDFKWNEVSVFALHSLKNVDSLLDYAVEGENYHLIGKCLRGYAGKKTQDKSRIITEKLLCSDDDNKRLLGVKILGAGKYNYFTLKKLLEVLSKEEKKLEEKFQKNGYSLWNVVYNSNLSIKETLFMDSSLDKEAMFNIRFKDFRVFNEIEDILLGFIILSEPEYMKLTHEIANLSITARGYLTEIIGRMRIKELEDEILDFLESRLDESIEPSIEVRSAAYRCLFDWERVEKENVRVLGILVNQYENPTASEDFGGFPNYIDRIKTSRLDHIDFVPEWVPELIEKIKKSKEISNSEINIYLKILKYYIDQVRLSRPFGDQVRFFKNVILNLDLLKLKEKQYFTYFINDEDFWELPLLVICGIALNGSEESIQELLELSHDENLYVAFFSILGLEMVSYINSEKDLFKKYGNEIKERKAIIYELIFQEEKTSFLLFFSQIIDFDFKNDTINNALKEAVLSLLKGVSDRKLLEDLMFEALDKKLIEQDLIMSWLENVGDEETSERLEESIKKLEIRDSDKAKKIIEKLRNKKI